MEVFLLNKNFQTQGMQSCGFKNPIMAEIIEII